MKAIEVAGVIGDDHKLVVDELLPVRVAGEVRVLVLWQDETELDEEREWLRFASKNAALAFDEEEDVDLYTLEDGKPFKYEG